MVAIQKLIIGALLIAVIVPYIAFAQQASPPAICLIARTTYLRGSRGAEVSIIQQFLKNQGFFDAEPTGFFGAVTARSLAQWQVAVGIISNATQGGAFGQKTWGYVVPRFCTSTPVDVGTNTCPTPPVQPTNVSCTTSWQKISNSDGCHVGWSCVTYISSTPTNSNFPPAISGIQGPLNLSAGMNYSWVIRASDPEGDPISYRMVWGDEGSNLAQVLENAAQGSGFGTSGSFSHKYLSSGSYTMYGYVKDPTGNVNKATVNVQVSDGGLGNSSSSPQVFACVMNGTTHANGKTILNPFCEEAQNTCGSTNYIKCQDGRWIGTNDDGFGSSHVTGSGACTLNGTTYSNGVGYDGAVSNEKAGSGFVCRADSFVRNDGSANSCICYSATRPTMGNYVCRSTAASLVCVDGGWRGANARKGQTYGAAVCISANDILVSSGGFVYLTTYDGSTQYYVCQSGGWYTSDSTRKALGRVAPPQVTGIVNQNQDSGYSQGGYYDTGAGGGA